MIPPNLFVLRQQMYQANHAYVQALIAYTAARNDGGLTDDARYAAGSWRTAAEQLEIALVALLQYLDSLQGDAYWAKESRQTRQIQLSLQRELALLQYRTHDVEAGASPELLLQE